MCGLGAYDIFGLEDLSQDVNTLREEKERIMAAIAEDKGRHLKKEEMIQFLQAQTS